MLFTRLARFLSAGMRRLCISTILCLFFASQAWTLADSDTVTWGGDNTRAGYQTGHNLDPNVVASSDFGQIFQTLLPGNFQGLAPEQIFSSPLVYTGKDGIQYVYVATTQNNLYKLDAKTGAIIASRNLHVPFLQVELESCVDINPLIGITATGVIDPDTGIWYVTSKTYADQFQNGNFTPQNPPGRLNGRYWQHAVHTEDLSEVSGWPIMLDGLVFRNNPNRMFIGGNEHSRPGALLVGNFLYTGYASHCVQYNYTGAIIGFNKKTGAIIEAFATQGGPEPNTVRGGGVWMSGGGLAYDGRGSMYFSTGNGYASQLAATGNSVPGRSPPTSLEEAAVNAKINDDGTLTIIDFFMPMEKTALDGADKDLGTSPLEILPSNVFTCPNHRRIGIVTGKSGKTYWLNLDNLGGYQMGANAGDAVIQVFQNENSVYAGAGVMPLGGGYVYIAVTQYQTHVFRFSCDPNGNAVFTKVTDTPDKNAYIIGTSHGTTTSLGGVEGTGLLWVSDVQGSGLRIYDPIPPSDGSPLRAIRNFTVPWVTKFSRPVFGDGRVYISTTQGYLYGFGSPVNAALNCSSPYDFGDIPMSNISAPVTVTCIALTGTTVSSLSLGDTSNFHFSNLPTFPLKLAVGQSFNFTTRCTPVNVGTISGDVTINLNNAQAGFSSTSIVTLKVTAHSQDPVLAIAPSSIIFNVIAGQPSSTLSTLVWNFGDNPLTIQSWSYSFISVDGPYVQANTTANGFVQIGDFTFTKIPTMVQPGTSAPISVIYAPTEPGNSTIYMKGFSNGGMEALTVTGFAGVQPKAVIEFQTTDGSGWVPYSSGIPFSFGTVYEAQTRNLFMRITNGGGPNALPLSVTVSKPPYGVLGIIGKSNNIDLAEGTSIAAGQSQTANLFCAVPRSQVNLPGYNGTTVWVLNTGDPNLGKQEIQFSCNAAIEQVGPLYPNGTAQYGYVGCFKEYNPGRQLGQLAYADVKRNNTNDMCTSTCQGQGYIFAGTQYSQECWCGNAIPLLKADEGNCNFGCTGNGSQTCGGNGLFHDSTWISVFGDSKRFNGNTTSAPLQLTPSVGLYNFVGCYADVSGRTLSLSSTSTNVMTVEACAIFCAGTTYFGLEYSAECYCGKTLNPASPLRNSSECNMQCKGSNSQYCGGPSRMQIYQLNGTPPVTSSSISSSASSIVSIISSIIPITPSSPPVSLPSSVSSASSSSSSSPSASISNSTTSVPSANPISSISLTPSSTISTPVSLNSSTPLTTPAVPSSSASTPISPSAPVSPSSVTSTSAAGGTSSISASPASSPPATSSTTTSTTASPSPLSCPASNGTIYTTSYGGQFLVECSVDRPGYDIFSGAQYVQSFEGCMALCDLTPGCVDISFVRGSGGACYPKSVIGFPSNDARILGGRLLVPRRSVSSTASSVGSSSSVLPVASTPAPTASSTPVSSTASSPSQISSSIPIPAVSTSVVASSFTSSVNQTSAQSSASPIVSLAPSSTTPSATPSPSSVGPSSTSPIATARISQSSKLLSPSISLASSSSTYTSTQSTAATNTTATQTSAATPVTSTPAVPSVGSYAYAGCWSDSYAQGLGRALQGPGAFRSSTMTPAMCASYCTQYAYFGLEFANECWCGPHPSNSIQVATFECTSPCAGDSKSICGAADRLSLYYSNDPFKASTDPAVPPSPIGNYSYAACYSDSGNPRLLPSGLTSSLMSVEFCLAAAEAGGYQYAGLEYGQECWMGNALAGLDKGNKVVGEGDCSMTCVGNRAELCGAGNRVNVWVRKAGA